MKKLYLHIGATKTGSSALQKMLWMNRAALRNQHILYTEIGSASNAHHLFGASIHPSAHGIHKDAFHDKDRTALFKEYCESIIEESEKTHCDRIILSTEYFWGRFSASLFDHLEPFLRKFNSYIIVYLRRQDEWFQSTYNQCVKSGVSESFDEWLNAQILKKDHVAHYDKTLKQWERVVDKKNIIVRSYERSNLRNGVFQDFLEIIGDVDCNALDTGSINANPSPNTSELEILRILNRMNMPHELASEFRRLIMQSSTKRPLYDKHALLSSADASKLLAIFETGNAEVARRYLQNSEGQLFHDPLPKPGDWEAWPGLTASDLVPVFLRLIGAARR